MAAIALKKMYARQNISGNSPRVEKFPCAATQSFVAGDLVYLVSGRLTVCGANPADILGVALEDAVSAADAVALLQLIPVQLAEPDTLFQINLASSTAGASVALTQAMLGGSCGLYKDGTAGSGLWYASGVTLGANDRLVIDKFIDAVGDTNARVLVRFLSKYYDLYHTS